MKTRRGQRENGEEATGKKQRVRLSRMFALSFKRFPSHRLLRCCSSFVACSVRLPCTSHHIRVVVVVVVVVSLVMLAGAARHVVTCRTAAVRASRCSIQFVRVLPPLHVALTTTRYTASSSSTASGSGSSSHAYSETLNLPKTAFSLRANASAREPSLRTRCCDFVYKWQLQRETDKTFVLHDGPPYANGPLHIGTCALLPRMQQSITGSATHSPLTHTGHALNKILKDIVNRYKLLCGYKIQYVPGWDCHGLPIELQALKEREALLKAKAKADNKLQRQQQQQQQASASSTSNDPPPSPLSPTQQQQSDREFNKEIELRALASASAHRAIELQRESFKSYGVLGDWDRPYATLRT
jgi:hypothetical protein